MSVITADYTDNVTVISAQSVAAGGIVRATLDLSTKLEAQLIPSVARGGNGSITNGPVFAAYRKVNGSSIPHPSPRYEETMDSASNANSTVNADAAAGAGSIVLASASGFSVGDVISIQDAGGGFTRLEWNVIAAISSNTLTLRLPLQYAHTAAQADVVRNKGECLGPIRLEGGAVYDVVFDHTRGATHAIVVRCLAQYANGYALG